jgi:hypothetical protein
VASYTGWPSVQGILKKLSNKGELCHGALCESTGKGGKDICTRYFDVSSSMSVKLSAECVHILLLRDCKLAPSWFTGIVS